MTEWQSLARTHTTLETLNDPFIVTVPCPHEDQALLVAAWMVEEIQRNAASEVAQRMKRLNDYSGIEAMERWRREGESLNAVQRLARDMARPDFMQIERQCRASALTTWTWQVMQGHDWDHKPKIQSTKEFETLGKSAYRYHHKYRGYEYFYDIWSNVHYGYLGRYCGFPETHLLDGAGIEQVGSDLYGGRWPTDRSASNGQGNRRFDDVTDHLSIRIGIALHGHFTPPQLTAQLLMDEITSADYPIKVGSKIPHDCQKARERTV